MTVGLELFAWARTSGDLAIDGYRYRIQGPSTSRMQLRRDWL